MNPLTLAVRQLIDAATQRDSRIDDPKQDGSGDDARPPTGDDYNDLLGWILALRDKADVIDKLTIENPDMIALDNAMLMACIAKCAQYESATAFTFYVNARVPADAPPYKFPGWLEFGINIQFGERRLFLGAIQRQPFAPIEFHS